MAHGRYIICIYRSMISGIDICWDASCPFPVVNYTTEIATENTTDFPPPNGGGVKVREMGPRKFQGNRSVGEILFHFPR